MRMGSLYRLVIVVFFLLAAGCNSDNDDTGAGFPPPAVKVQQVVQEDLPVLLRYHGQVVGYREAQIFARVSGFLERINYQEGEFVDAGSSLFTIEPELYRASFAEAEAQYSATKARYNVIKKDTDRDKSLLKEGAISEQEYETRKASLAEASATESLARARLTSAKLQLTYSQVLSPISGYATKSTLREGSFVQASRTILTTVMQVNPLYINFGIPQRDLDLIDTNIREGRIRLPAGDAFSIAVRHFNGSVYNQQGSLSFLDFRLLPETAVSEARAEIANPDKLLRPGEFVYVELQGAIWSQVLTVPQLAVLKNDIGSFVYVIEEENKVMMRPVRLGEWVGESWIVIDGLDSGERVIVEGLAHPGLYHGGTVRIVENAPSPDDGSAPDPHNKH